MSIERPRIVLERFPILLRELSSWFVIPATVASRSFTSVIVVPAM